ncbi:hypothetical protein L2W58_00035 [Dethiosulfovibrio sp. F2B]|uniref:hypothetical protein n=1 Tax=Dethiosulfovibrio faecalis TaxID=2720018 RepID=UPI001F30D83F|nr:hypothetical protein [Dethiosulfovibrio faecalis]MCF4150196.1 hypothetical protein [Dethiosulfovibrio faecalis]
MSWLNAILFYRRAIDKFTMEIEPWPLVFDAPEEWSRRPSKPAPAIEIQTGKTRPFPLAIRQDPDELLAIESYDYDASNEDFMAYAKSRLGKTRFNDSRNWFGKAVRSVSLTKREFMESKACVFRKIYLQGRRRIARGGKIRKLKLRHVQIIPDSRRLESWEIIQITRGHLQDVWELWRREVRRGLC